MKRNAALRGIISGMLGGMLACAGALAGERSVRKEAWGTAPEGGAVDLFTLTNPGGLRARIMTHGATLVAMETPDRHGELANVTLFLDSFADYAAGHPLFGSVVGRYANRIAGGGFTLDGREYRLETVNEKTGVHIHGGKTGFQRQRWEAEPFEDAASVGVRFSLTSPDGHEGYPGTLRVRVTYRLTDEDSLAIEYEAQTDKATHVNLTNHAYWNLAGAGAGDVLGHELVLNADRLLEFDEHKIPTGKYLPVAGTPFDFRERETIGARIGQVPGGGYDHCYVLNDAPRKKGLRFCARVRDAGSGRVMEVYTTQPGVQCYTANYLSEKLSGGGKPYGRYHGLCLETQHFPDAPNKPEFPSTVLRPGEKFKETTEFRFGISE